jgi:hypothetical protein
MSDIVAAQDLYMNADQDECVSLKSGDAAFLLVRKGRVVPRTHTKFVTQAGNPKKGKKQKEQDAPVAKELVADEDKGDG